MKTKKGQRPKAQVRTMNGRRMVVLAESEYHRLCQKADEWEPLLPPADQNGNRPALETMRVLLARDILRARRRLGLTQVELARRAGIRPETLNRIEQAKHTPSVATVERIDRALQKTRAAT